MRSDVAERVRRAAVVPAHPLALDAAGGVDLRAQRALTRYYMAAGASGVAVGVHTTQFALHADRGALGDVWALAVDTAAECATDPLLIAGVCGDVADAVAEANIAAAAGYEAVLLCPWGMREPDEKALLQRAVAVGEILPTVAFYLQEKVGGRRLGRDFWRRMFDLESVVAVKVAPFDRYRTNDVMQVLLEHPRWNDITVLTGNDDAIVQDLTTPYRRVVGAEVREVRIHGGLLGQWAVGSRAAAHLVSWTRTSDPEGFVTSDLLAAAVDLVEVNSAVFDADNDFAGCVAGINEVLRQQGLISSARCINEWDRLSAGQEQKIACARRRYPQLFDEEFVAENRDAWLA